VRPDGSSSYVTVDAKAGIFEDTPELVRIVKSMEVVGAANGLPLDEDVGYSAATSQPSDNLLHKLTIGWISR
jgi:hypothetical protein